jgi:hypothetical protein
MGNELVCVNIQGIKYIAVRVWRTGVSDSVSAMHCKWVSETEVLVSIKVPLILKSPIILQSRRGSCMLLQYYTNMSCCCYLLVRHKANSCKLSEREILPLMYFYTTTVEWTTATATAHYCSDDTVARKQRR